MIYTCKKMRIVTLIFVAIISNNIMAAAVSNVSDESFVQYGKEDAYWAVSVSCDDNSSTRVVQRKTDSNSWCPKGNSTLCSADKALAVKNACSSAYEDEALALAKKQAQRQQRRRQAALARAQEKQAAEQSILDTEKKLQAKIAIEEQLLEIEQKRLELSKREVEISRRIVEIDEILKLEEDL